MDLNPIRLSGMSFGSSAPFPAMPFPALPSNTEPVAPASPPTMPAPPPPGPMRVRRNKSALLYLRVLDARRTERGAKCACAKCLGKCLGDRDRRYGFPKRYGMKTTVTTRRVDRIDPVRELY